ncbi:MAG: chorismate-binding protein [Actinomycetaceae bacterium]|nr:chorismate-binding protein [Actinomycetaceae bacterium]
MSEFSSPGNLEWGQTWPTLSHFTVLAQDRRVIPVARRIIADEITPVGLYRKVTESEDIHFILESAEHDGAWSRWSFVGAGARAALISDSQGARWVGEAPVNVLQNGPITDVITSALTELRAPHIDGLPPLTGALVGTLGWALSAEWEPHVRDVVKHEEGLPDVALLMASNVYALDHKDGSVWLIANAWNINNRADGVEDAYADAVRRLDEMEAVLSDSFVPRIMGRGTSAKLDIQIRTGQSDFETGVRGCQQSIYDGDAFQIVLSTRTDIPISVEPIEIYRALRTVNPSPYMYCFALPAGNGEYFHVVGSSPETLVKVSGDRAWSFPIAGSRPRGSNPAEDLALEEDLLADEKEIAEHIMLVDLARNDLSKVCDPASVNVETLMEVKRFSHIMHVSSTVTGRVDPDVNRMDVLSAVFPAGTLSGAPKPKAIEIIEMRESLPRGVYGGVVGYFDLSGDADFAIAIRTAVIRHSIASIQAGAGIVADSQPAKEWEETQNKAAAMVRAIQLAHDRDPLVEHR